MANSLCQSSFAPFIEAHRVLSGCPACILCNDRRTASNTLNADYRLMESAILSKAFEMIAVIVLIGLRHSIGEWPFLNRQRSVDDWVSMSDGSHRNIIEINLVFWGSKISYSLTTQHQAFGSKSVRNSLISSIKDGEPANWLVIGGCYIQATHRSFLIFRLRIVVIHDR